MRRLVHGIVPAFDIARTDVPAVVPLLAITSLTEKFVGDGDEDRDRAIHGWFAADNDVEAIDQTLDVVLNDEDDGE